MWMGFTGIYSPSDKLEMYTASYFDIQGLLAFSD